MKKIIYRLPLCLWMWFVRREWKPKKFLFLETESQDSRDFSTKWAKDRIAIAHWCPEVWGLPEWMMKLYLKSIN